MSLGKTHAQATSIVLKITADPKRQHAASNKLIKMCKTSPLVTTASKEITAQVRSAVIAYKNITHKEK